MNPEIDKSAEPGKTVAVVRPAEPTLEGWKEIATFLKRDVRTVMRWEKSEGLPVRRHLHNQRSSVYALPPELKSWQAARAPQPAVPQKVAWWRPRPAVGLAAAIFLLMFSFRGGPLAELQAQAQSKPASTLTESYGELDLDPDGSVSPDRKLFAGTNWTSGDLMVWELASGHVARLQKSNNDYLMDPRWSPDGHRIAYVAGCGVGCQLRVTKASGGDSELLYQGPESIAGVLDWSPDANSILCALRMPDRKFGLGLFSVADRKVALLRAFDTGVYIEASFSPDGKTIVHEAFEHGKRHLGLMSVADHSDVDVESSAEDKAPIWTPDGKLLFVSNRSGQWDLWSLEVRGSKPVGEPRMSYADVGNIAHFTGWLDNHALLFSRYNAPTGTFNAVAVDTASGTRVGEPKPLIPEFVGQQLDARWSPDGQNIAFVTGSERKVYVYTPATKTLQQIATPELSRPGLMGWYGSSRALALWTLWNSTGIKTLYRLSLSGNLEELYKDAHSRTVGALSPDGNTFAYARWSDGTDESKPYNSICVYDVKGRRMLKEFVAPAATTYFQPQLSADSSVVLFVEHSGPKEKPSERIVAAPIAGGEPRTVVKLDGGVLGRWSITRDGAFLAYTWYPHGALEAATPDKPAEMKFFVASSHGGEPRALEIPKYHGDTGFTWSPDGKQIGYITSDRRAQWLTLSNFLK